MSDQNLPRGAFLRPQLPEAALYGLPGDVTRELAHRSDADPAALLVTFLAMFGNATGGQPHFNMGGQAQPGRLFTLIVGEAATGRKGTALALVGAVMDEADPEWSESCIMTGAQSGEAIVERVADSGPLAIIVGRDTPDKRLMIVEPEYGRFLTRMAGNTLSAVMRNAWDGTPLEISRSRGRGNVKATNAHISMVAQITPAELIRHYPRLSAGNGLESRCLYAYVSKQQRPVSPFASAEVPEDLTKRVGRAIVGSRQRVLELTDPISRFLCERRNVLPSVVMGFGDDVEDGWHDIEDALPEVNRDLGGMFDREFTHVVRLASLYALADESSMVCMPHIEAAIALWTYCARSAEVIFSIPAGQGQSGVDPRRRAQVWDVLYRAYPGWLSRTQLRDAFSRNGSRSKGAIPKDLATILDSLVDEGRAEVKQLGTKGRPRTEYRLSAEGIAE